jgi:hypothetical protein
MKIIKKPSYEELPKEEELGKLLSGMGWLEVLLFIVFLVPMVILPLLTLLAKIFAVIINLITK